ncbi:MAG: metallophosphoesterase family protein [Nanoarchaeota archaeon]|nr:metallophosphoesterase family protein [Nanoarchaeota archaeon]
MKSAILSDIHGNLEAFQAVLCYCDRIGVEQIFSLGDNIGYGPNPAECLDLLVTRHIPSAMGNHEHEVQTHFDPASHLNISLCAIVSLEWTRDQLSPEHIRYVKSLPYTILIDDKHIGVHASLDEPDRFLYIMASQDRTLKSTFEILQYEGYKTCLIGHTHMPRVFYEDGSYQIPKERNFTGTTTITLDISQGRYVINVGAVGVSRDGDPRASFLLMDNDQYNIVRVPYDYEQTRKKLLATQLPLCQELADRIMKTK